MSEEKRMYFMFSSSQLKLRREVEQKLGKQYRPGTVIVQGVPKQFTEIIDDPKNSAYSDSIIVTSGILSKTQYNGGD